MPRFTVDQVRSCMEYKDRIRNMSVIAHVDHGKTTLSDSLIAAAGFMNMDEAGDRRLLDTRGDEAARGITIKSASISLLHRITQPMPGIGAEGDEFLINLIDCPGHVDFSSEVTAALRVTDGALVVVDCVEGVCVQTETVLRQALAERIVPVLMMNKLDRAFFELQLEPEEAYQSFARAIESCNVVISTYHDAVLGDVSVDPVKGTVGFGAGLHGWAFTLRDFARMYAPKWKMDEERVMQLLWGDNFFDDEQRKWTKSSVSPSGATLERGFVKFVLKPLMELLKLTMDDQRRDDLLRRLEALKITLKSEQLAKSGKALMKAVMQRFLPAADSILNMVVARLPSPQRAQQYRVETLYEGDLADKYADGIRRCDPAGPLVVYVSKMVPTKDNSRFIAFGRVFSGTIKGGAKVRIMGGNYVVGKKEDVAEMNVQRVVVMMGKITDTVDSVPCGNVCGMIGIDNFVVRSATIVDEEAVDAHPLRAMKYSVAPVVRVAVKTKNAADLPKLVKGLRQLAKSDFLLQVTTSESGEHIVAGAGELHLEIVLKDLKEDFMGDTEIEVSEPVVQFRETVTARSSMTCLAKSSNKHNRAFVTAEPLSADLCVALDAGKITMKDDPKTRAKFLVDNFQWDATDARKIWTFGPEPTYENILVDTTKAVQYLTETRDSFVSGFQWATKAGVLCEEPVRGMRINILDAVLHRDSAHRGGDQVMPMARRAYYAAMLTAQPALLEPVYLVNITAPHAVIGSVYNVLSKRRGEVFAEEPREGTPMVELRAFLPVLESFKFNEVLRQATGGQAFPQAVFDHWQVLPGSPDDVRSLCYESIRATRVRKGLSADIPALERFLDRL